MSRAIEVRSKKNKGPKIQNHQSGSAEVTSEFCDLLKNSSSSSSSSCPSSSGIEATNSLHVSVLKPILNSINEVLVWTKNVIEGVKALKWEHIGFEDDEEGPPIHSMSNPNDTIDKLLAEYEENVSHDARDSLRPIESCNPTIPHSRELAFFKRERVESDVPEVPSNVEDTNISCISTTLTDVNESPILQRNSHGNHGNHGNPQIDFLYHDAKVTATVQNVPLKRRKVLENNLTPSLASETFHVTTCDKDNSAAFSEGVVVSPKIGRKESTNWKKREHLSS